MRCAPCPCEEGLDCPGEGQVGHWACRMAAGGDPRELRHVRGVARLRAGLATDPPPPPPPPPEPARPAMTAEERGRLEEALRLRPRMLACPYRVAGAGCGCAGGSARCNLGKGRDGVVTQRDCFACLREAEAPQASPAPPPGSPG